MFTTATMFDAVCNILVPVIMPDIEREEYGSVSSYTTYSADGTVLDVVARDGAFRVVSSCSVMWADYYRLEINYTSNDDFFMFVNRGARDCAEAERFATFADLVERVRGLEF